MPARLSHNEVLQLVKLYQKGHSIEEVARLTGRASCTVQHYVKQAGVMRTIQQARRLKSRTWQQRDRIVWLYRQGHSIAQIASLLGVWYSSVRHVLVEAGIVRARGTLSRKQLERRWQRIREAGRLVVVEGLPIQQVARMLGVSEPTARAYVRRYCHLMGIPYPDRRARHEALHRRIIATYQKVGSKKKVAEILGVHPITVSRHLKRSQTRHAA